MSALEQQYQYSLVKEAWACDSFQQKIDSFWSYRYQQTDLRNFIFLVYKREPFILSPFALQSELSINCVSLLTMLFSFSQKLIPSPDEDFLLSPVTRTLALSFDLSSTGREPPAVNVPGER